MKEIKFTTKYELGQEAVAFDSFRNRLNNIKIVEIQFDTDGINSKIWYRDKNTGNLFREEDVYPTREEFINQL